MRLNYYYNFIQQKWQDDNGFGYPLPPPRQAFPPSKFYVQYCVSPETAQPLLLINVSIDSKIVLPNFSFYLHRLTNFGVHCQ